MSRLLNGWIRGVTATVALLAGSLPFAATPVSLAQDDTEPDATVTMVGLRFNPVEVHIPAGGTVLWVNSSRVAHTVTADDDSWDSGDVEVGDTFSMSFDTSGTYGYYCIPHGSPGVGMAATVIVDE